MFEDQIGRYLETFKLPPDYRDQILSLYARTLDGRADVETRRREIKARLARLKDLYRWGDIEREDYQDERDRLTDELALLRTSDDQAAALERTAEYLADLPKAWADAAPEQRNELARTLFAGITLKGNRVEAVQPQPEYAPFFVMDYERRTGDAKMRKRRGTATRDKTVHPRSGITKLPTGCPEDDHFTGLLAGDPDPPCWWRIAAHLGGQLRCVLRDHSAYYPAFGTRQGAIDH